MWLHEINKWNEHKITQVEMTWVILSDFDKYYTELIGEETDIWTKLTKEWFKLTKNILNKFTLNKQKQIWKLLVDKKIKFENYFYANWFPNNQTIDYFNNFLNNEFWIKQEDVKEKQEDVKEKQEDVKEKQENILNNIKKDILGYEDRFNKDFIKLLDSADIAWIIEYLENWENLDKVLSLLVEIDRENWVDLSSPESVYSKFTFNLVELKPDLQSRINSFNSREGIVIIKNKSWVSYLNNAVAFASLGTDKNIKTNGSKMEAIDDEWDKIFVDTAEVPPLRQIALNGSDYRMETETPVWDFYEPTVSYETDKKPIIDEKLTYENNLKWFENELLSVENKLNELVEKEKFLNSTWESLSESDLQLRYDLEQKKIDLEEKIIDVKEQLKESERKLLELEEKYKQDLRAKVKSYSDKMKERDEKTKEVLGFLKQTWFDLLPKTLTDQIIREIQWNVLDVKWIKLNQETLDLENGQFWETENESGWDKWKDNIKNFLDKMLYWEIGWENSIFKWKEFKWEFWASIDPLEFNSVLEDSWIKTATGWNINMMRNNLKKEVK